MSVLAAPQAERGTAAEELGIWCAPPPEGEEGKARRFLLQIPNRLPARAPEAPEDPAAARLRRAKLEDEPPRRTARRMCECALGKARACPPGAGGGSACVCRDSVRVCQRDSVHTDAHALHNL